LAGSGRLFFRNGRQIPYVHDRQPVLTGSLPTSDSRSGRGALLPFNARADSVITARWRDGSHCSKCSNCSRGPAISGQQPQHSGAASGTDLASVSYSPKTRSTTHPSPANTARLNRNRASTATDPASFARPPWARPVRHCAIAHSLSVVPFSTSASAWSGVMRSIGSYFDHSVFRRRVCLKLWLKTFRMSSSLQAAVSRETCIGTQWSRPAGTRTGSRGFRAREAACSSVS
jgi:hypothetical protein